MGWRCLDRRQSDSFARISGAEGEAVLSLFRVVVSLLPPGALSKISLAGTGGLPGMRRVAKQLMSGREWWTPQKCLLNFAAWERAFPGQKRLEFTPYFFILQDACSWNRNVVR